MQRSVAIVTGGASGIGAALCKSFLSRGVKVSFRNSSWSVIILTCSFKNYSFIVVSKVTPVKFIIFVLFYDSGQANT